MTERTLRQDLGVPAHANEKDIIQIIRGKGWEPALMSEKFGPDKHYVCPISNGEFSSQNAHPHPDYPGMHNQRNEAESRILALLRALRLAAQHPCATKLA